MKSLTYSNEYGGSSIAVYLFERRSKVTAKRTAFYWWACLALAIVVGNLLQGCAHRPTVVEIANWPPYAIALTTCSKDNKPVIVLRQGFEDDVISRRYTLAHEMEHYRQMKGDCQKVQSAYRASEDVRWQMELAAYCEDSRVRLKEGASAQSVKERLYGILKMLYNADSADVRCPAVPP